MSTARHASIGDRMTVTCHSYPDGRDGSYVEVTTVVTVDRVKRLSCGCDEAWMDRPNSPAGDRMYLLPVGCYHDLADDYDAAREAAGSVSLASSS